jgi:predicted RNA-binding protein with PIN domain
VVTILVDARNVLRSTWPNIPESEVVAASRRWARENGARAVVVFDGVAPGGLVGEHDREGVTIVGTGPEESADTWLTHAARRLRADSAPFWLVTSDRELRANAGAGAERIVGGGRFARELRRV